MESFLKYIADIVQLTPAEEDIFLSKVHHRTYLKGQFVLQAGDVARHTHFVLKGCVKTYYLDSNGHEHIVNFGIENWWVGDLGSYISQTPAEYNVKCLENTELVQVPHDSLEFLYAEIPRLERFFRIIVERAYVSSRRRIIDGRTLSSIDKYLQFKQHYPEIEQRVPQYMIASYLGFTPEFLSKIRNQLIKGQ